MKLFYCGGVIPGCPVEFGADTDDEIVAQVVEHARDHGVAEMTAELDAVIRSQIRTS